MIDKRPQADPILVAQLHGEARHHARWRELSSDEEAAAVAALRERAAGRTDLLAQVAGLLEGFAEGELNEPIARQAAGLCRKAGADPEAIPAWIEEGRRRRAAARLPPFSGGLAAPARVFDHRRDITTVRASTDYWADGGLVATPADMIAFLRALHDSKIISPASLRTMQTWHNRDGSPTPPFPFIQYGYGLWHFQMTGPLSALKNVVPTWGATGSTGSFLYYSQPLDLYIAGTVDSATSVMASFFLMAGAMSLVSGNDHSPHAARADDAPGA